VAAGGSLERDRTNRRGYWNTRTRPIRDRGYRARWTAAAPAVLALAPSCSVRRARFRLAVLGGQSGRRGHEPLGARRR
jgi:hypothetical protein